MALPLLTQINFSASILLVLKMYTSVYILEPIRLFFRTLNCLVEYLSKTGRKSVLFIWTTSSVSHSLYNL